MLRWRAGVPNQRVNMIRACPPLVGLNRAHTTWHPKAHRAAAASVWLAWKSKMRH